MATRYLDAGCAPAPAACGAQPLAPHEIDKHPDGARIWATIAAIREEAEENEEERKYIEENEREQNIQLTKEVDVAFTKLKEDLVEFEELFEQICDRLEGY